MLIFGLDDKAKKYITSRYIAAEREDREVVIRELEDWSGGWQDIYLGGSIVPWNYHIFA